MPRRDNPHRGEGTFNSLRSPPVVPQRCKLPTWGNRTPTPAWAAPSGYLRGKSPPRENKICFILKSKSTEAEPEGGSSLPFQWKSRLWTRAKLNHFCNFLQIFLGLFPVSSPAGISCKAYLENKRLVLSRTAWEHFPPTLGLGRGVSQERVKVGAARPGKKAGVGGGAHVDQFPRDTGNVFLQSPMTVHIWALPVSFRAGRGWIRTCNIAENYIRQRVIIHNDKNLKKYI